MPNFVVLDTSRPDIAHLLVAMLQARIPAAAFRLVILGQLGDRPVEFFRGSLARTCALVISNCIREYFPRPVIEAECE